MEIVVIIGIYAILSAIISGVRNHERQKLEQTPMIYVETPKEELKDPEPEPVYNHQTLSHILLYGSPGIGKSTLCEIIANQLSKQYGHKITFHTKIAGQLKTASDVENLIKQINYGDIVLIDEIASLKLPIEEIFYSVLQDFIYYPISDTLQIQEYSLRLDHHSDENNIIQIPKCTFLAATTNSGSLSRPLRERFQVEVELKRLDEQHLSEIALGFDKVKQSKSFSDYKGQDRVITLINMHIDSLETRAKKITKEAAEELARRSLGTPRLVNNFRLQSSCRAGELVKDTIDIDDVHFALNLLGIDKNGIHPVDRRLIKYLLERENKPSGVNALAAVIGASPSDVREIIVPRLSVAGVLTRDARSWLILSDDGINKYKNYNFNE